MKNKNKKPLKKYQSGGWGDFLGSNLFNPSASDVNMGLFGRGFLDISNVPKQYMNLGDNPFGAQLMSGTAKSAQLLGTIPGVSEMGDTMPEWGGEYAQKMKQDIAKEKGLKYNEWSGKWKNDKGEVYTNKELEDLAGQRYDTQKSQREQLRKFQPMLAPLLQLNELGEMQKTSYRQGQKSDFYDVTNKPMGMETRGFFAKQGGNTSRLQQMLGYNVPKAQNNLNTGYSWNSPSSKSAAKVGPPSKSNYATSVEKPTKEVLSQELQDAIRREEAKEQKERLKNNAYQREFYDIKKENTSTQFPNEGERRAIERRDLVNQNIQFQKDYVQSPDVRKRLYNQIKEYYPWESNEKINSLVDERIQQYLYKLDNLGINFNSSEEIREKGSLAYYQPLKNEVYLPVDKDKNTLQSFASHEIRHAYDLKPTLVDKAIGLNTTSMAISDILSKPRTALDEVANVQKNSKYKEQELQGVEVPYENQTDEKTARMMQLRVYADQKGLHKKGSNITRDTFDKVIKSIEEEGQRFGGSAALDALETLQEADKVDKDEIFRLWNETVDVGDKNSYNSQVENNQNPIISAKQGMRTPPVTEVYRMMGAHQGLPQTSFKIPKNSKAQSDSEYNKLLDSVIMEEGGNLNNILYKEKQNNMYNNNQRVSRLAMLLGGGLIRNYQDGGMMQQPMSEEEAIMQEQMMQEAMMQQQMAQDPRMQEQMAQEQMAQQQMGQQQTAQPQQPGQNKYMQLPQEQQVEVYKMLIDYIMINGIDALEQQFPEEYQFFEEFSDQIEGEQEEGGEEEGMETEANRMEMGGEEEMYSEEEAQSEFPTDEEEVPVGARPGENAMRPAEPMEGAQQMKQGGIPERYRKMGFNKVGQKRQSDRPGKKWAVLAKKGDQYKIVHGGAKGMEDFKQHGSKDRQKRFWDRMGGKDSAKARDPFSPLYWHKRFGTW